MNETIKDIPLNKLNPFLKNEYGIGGSSHAVSGIGWFDSSGKGIKLQKPDCADVELNWNKVLSRFESIIRNDRYFTPEEKDRYEEMHTWEAQFQSHFDTYNDIKHDHPDDIVLFQVGDFFEMYGEDAKAASELLDLHLASRPVAGVGRVEMCGIPANRLEEFVERLRESHSVTISPLNTVMNEHTCAAADKICVKGVRGCFPDKVFLRFPCAAEIVRKRIKDP